MLVLRQVPARSLYVTSYPQPNPISQQPFLQTNFIQQPLPPGSTTGAGGGSGQSGALDKGQRMSTGLTTFYQFWYGTVAIPTLFHRIPCDHFAQGVCDSYRRRLHCRYVLGPL